MIHNSTRLCAITFNTRDEDSHYGWFMMRSNWQVDMELWKYVGTTHIFFLDLSFILPIDSSFRRKERYLRIRGLNYPWISQRLKNSKISEFNIAKNHTLTFEMLKSKTLVTVICWPFQNQNVNRFSKFNSWNANYFWKNSIMQDISDFNVGRFFVNLLKTIIFRSF